MKHISYIFFILLILSGCSNPLNKEMVTMDVSINNVLVQGEDLVFKKNEKTYVAKGEASKFKTLKEAKRAEFQKYTEANEEEKSKMKVSWFVRFADYGGKITLME